MPSPLVVTERSSPVSSFFTAMVAVGTTAPLESLSVPVSAPKPAVCALTRPDTANRIAAASRVIAIGLEECLSNMTMSSYDNIPASAEAARRPLGMLDAQHRHLRRSLRLAMIAEIRGRNARFPLISFTHPDAIQRNVMDPKPRLIDVTHVSFSLSPVARLFLNALSSCSN